MNARPQDVATPKTPPPSHWPGRLAALLEVVGVFVVGSLIARLAARPIYRYTVQRWREVMIRKAVPAALASGIALGIVLAQIILALTLLPLSGVLALAAALMLEFREKKSNRTLHPTGFARG